MPDDRRMPTSTWSYHYDALVELYSLFFPLFQDEFYRVVDVVRPLSAFQLPELPTAPLQDEDFPSLVAYLIDRNVLYAQDQSEGAVEDISWLVAQALFDLMARFLGVAPADVEEVLNALAYDAFNFPLLGDINKVDPPYTNPCEHHLVVTVAAGAGAAADGGTNASTGAASDIWEACSDLVRLEEDDDERCSWYCRTIIGNVSLQARVKELFEEASHLTGWLQPGYPLVLLPLCRYPALPGEHLPDVCWRKIVNDQGICYTAQTGVFSSNAPSGILLLVRNSNFC